MTLEHFIFFVVPVAIGLSALTTAIAFNIYKLYKLIIAERKFTTFLMGNEEFQSKSMLRPTVFSLAKYFGLFSKMLDKTSLDAEEGRLIFYGISQKYPACLYYMQKLWDKSLKDIKTETIACMEEEL